MYKNHYHHLVDRCNQLHCLQRRMSCDGKSVGILDPQAAAEAVVWTAATERLPELLKVVDELLSEFE